MLAARLRGAAPGSREHEDLTWILDLAGRYGPGAGPEVPEGRRRTVARALRVDAWWYAHRGAPARRVLVSDPDGIILTYREGHGFSVNPVATAGRWQGLNDALTAEELAEPLLEMGVRRVVDGRAMTVWEYYDVADQPEVVRPGVSGMAQGRLAEMLAHARRHSGAIRFARASEEALQAFAVPVERGGVRSEVAWPAGSPGWPWYVERAYPGESPWKGAALNGFMVTLLSLRATAAVLAATPDEPPGAPAPPSGEPEGQPGAEPAARATAGDGAPPRPRGPMEVAPDAEPSPDDASALEGSALARRLADDGVATLRHFLPLHDSGSWSYYGMLTPGRPWRSYLADLNYHCYHVALLERLDARWPADGFGAVAARWRGYVDRAGLTCPSR
jgi:hypothetical protein